MRDSLDVVNWLSCLEMKGVVRMLNSLGVQLIQPPKTSVNQRLELLMHAYKHLQHVDSLRHGLMNFWKLDGWNANR